MYSIGIHSIYFSLFLDGQPILDIGRDLIININPSDDAFGVFSFADGSLSQIITEQPGGVVVSFVVERGNKGAFGQVTLYWEVENGAMDVTPSNGTIDFNMDTRTSSFFVTVNNDNVSIVREN